MKKILQLLTSLLLLVAMFSCDNSTSGTTFDSTSDWWVKGSFDGWKDSVDDETRHFFTIDEVDNNILTYEVTGLYTLDYEFVLVDAAGTEWKAPTATTAVSDTALTFVSAENANATFTAAFTTYTIKVDITDAEAPSVTIEAGSTAATAPTFEVLADNLIFKGGIFDSNWTAQTGVLDATAKTVTYDDLTIVSNSGEFGIDGIDGWFEGLTIDSPTVEGESTTPANFLKSGGNSKLINVPKVDSVYTVVITIDPEATNIEEKYSIAFTLKTLGTEDWVIDFAWLAPRTKIKGDLFDIGWTATAGTVNATAKTVTYEVTIDNASGSFGFEIFDGGGWATIEDPLASGDAAVEIISNANGNGQFSDAAVDDVYTVVVTIDDTVALDAGRYMLSISKN
ncbi:hypothetical protein EW093_04450 [Thiospirochaeta perfilievii]|uniref:SusF/SusE family outer membrane protein n=1 Tax=Thiospirochaeta perfilievii TaxID=252967 RepID=A0A5C1Q8Z8_9SPIO|nr:hypothetical protein [Thiospirochaeta perfilievii]QEN03981.1 hypothetical protein EW093_04450 [Thiospirochaeta perfilievii]